MPTETGAVEVEAARDELAALAAAAQDRHLVAQYVYSRAGQPDRTIVFTSANDGSWRVDVPGGALGGAATSRWPPRSTGCSSAPCRRSAGRSRRAAYASVTATTRSRAGRPPDPASAHRLAGRAHRPARAVGGGPGQRAGGRHRHLLLGGVHFGVAQRPADVGIYCYDRDGTTTGVRTGAGTLRLAAPPGPAPATVQLAGPVVVDRDPLDTAAPPTPDPSDSPSAGTS